MDPIEAEDVDLDHQACTVELQERAKVLEQGMKSNVK